MTENNYDDIVADADVDLTSERILIDQFSSFQSLNRLGRGGDLRGQLTAQCVIEIVRLQLLLLLSVFLSFLSSETYLYCLDGHELRTIL